MFWQGSFNAPEAVGHVVRAALLCGASSVTASVEGDWFCVTSPTDWLVEDGGDAVESAFQRIVPFRAGGDNSMRPEVLLTTFARDVVTVAASEVLVIKGSADGLPAQLHTGEHGRAIGFTTP